MIGSCVKHDNFLIDKSYLEGSLVHSEHHTVKLEFLLIIMQSDIGFYNSRQPMLTFILTGYTYYTLIPDYSHPKVHS